MTGMMTYINKSKKGIAFLIMLTFASLVSFDANAAGATCGVKFNGGSVTPECPDGSKARYDVSPKCIEQSNNAAGNCINTMPVTNVARIPEDVCFRGKGWSRKRNHNGMDYAAGMGTAVTAAMDGEVIRFTFGTAEPARGVCQSSGGGYGNVIYIQHKGCNGTYITRYGHLTNKIVPGMKNGVKVKKGQLIGYVGGTGGACGRPHLHFELRGPGDALVNPICDQIQGVCNCKTPLPSSGLTKCKDATFGASSSTPIDTAAGTPAISIAQNSSEQPQVTVIGTKCAPFEEVRNHYRQWGCIFCKPFQIMFNTASVMAKKSYDTLAKSVILVVLIAFAIWLSFTIIRFVSTMEIREPRIFIKTLLNQSFRVLVVVILLNSGLSQILSTTVDPVFSTGLQVAQLAGKLSDTCDLGADKMTIIGSDQGGLSPAMGTGILCTIKSIQDQISDIMALGRVCFCLSWTSENMVFVFPHIGYLFTGIMFYVGGFLLLFIYPFLLVDSLLKLAIAVALLPAALGAFAFKITAHYLQKLWEIFLNAIFSFIFLSMIIFIISSVAADTVSEVLTGDTGVNIVIFWWMVEGIKVIFVCLLGWVLLGEAKKFADNFAKGLGFGNDIGSPTGSTAMEFLGKRPGKYVAKKVGKAGKEAGKGLRNVASEKLHQVKINSWKSATEASKNGRVMLMGGGDITQARNEDGSVMTDGNGNIMYDTTSARQKMLGRKEYRSFSTDANGNTRMNVVEEKKNGKKTVTETDSYATVTNKFDKDGTQESQNAKANAAFLKYAYRKDGTINGQTINDFMQNSLLSEEAKQIMVVKSMMNERLGASYGGARLDNSFQDREVKNETNSEGQQVLTINQTNMDGSKSSFKLTFGSNDRVMSEFTTTGTNGKGTSFATDGIVQRKSYIDEKTEADGSKTTVRVDKYAFSSYYSQISSRPLYSNGDFAENIPADQIMFGKDDIKQFANQVGKKGNKHYSFNEFN